MTVTVTPAWKSFANSPLGYPVPGNVDVTAKVKVGTRAKFYDETLGECDFIYLPGVASLAYGDAVIFDLLPGSATVSRLTTTNGAGKGRPVAFATAALTSATATFGWYQVAGVAIINVAAAYAIGLLYTTATAGVLDDAVVALASIVGAGGSSAIDTPNTGQAYATIMYPHTQGTVA